jgi:hypothetical protein
MKLWPATPYLDDVQQLSPVSKNFSGSDLGTDIITDMMFPLVAKTEAADWASETTRDGESETQSNADGGNLCGACETKIGDTADPLAIDGIHVCGRCYPIFQPSGFVQEYDVCVNPCCRRKWRKLAPKALGWFCPSCRKHLEVGVGCPQGSLDAEDVKRMYNLWCDIYSELAEIMCLPKDAFPRVGLSARTRTDGEQSAEEKRQEWYCFAQALRAISPDSPSPQNVKNWNSLVARKNYYRGVVRRNNQHFVCTIEAQMEVHADLTTSKRTPVGPRDYYVLDWESTLEEGEEVCFMAFPNPAVNERAKLSKVVRVLTKKDDVEVLQSPSSRPFVTGSPGVGNEFNAFADLMTWSQDQPKARQSKQKVKSGKNTSDKRPVEKAGDVLEILIANPERSQPLPSTGFPVSNSSSILQKDAELHVCTTLQRRPSFCPLSPTAAYFGD